MGHIFTRNGHWSYRIDVGKTINGKRPRHTVSGFETKELAHQAMEKAEQQVQDGTYFTRRLPIKEIIQEWLEDLHSDEHVKQKERLNHVAVRYILPYFGEWKLGDVTNHAVLAFYQFLSNRQSEKVGNEDIRDVQIALLKVFEYCVEKKYSVQEDVPTFPDITGTTDSISFWTLNQVRIFLEAAEAEREYPLYILLVTTGIDTDELFSLNWRMIDNKKQVMRITDTKNEQRDISLPKVTSKALDNWHHLLAFEAEQAGSVYTSSTHLVVDENGKYLLRDTLQQAFEQVCKAVELPLITLEDIRHTHALLLLENDLSYEKVAHHLGHHSVKITKDLYKSHIKSNFDCAKAVMNALF